MHKSPLRKVGNCLAFRQLCMQMRRVYVYIYKSQQNKEKLLAHS